MPYDKLITGYHCDTSTRIQVFVDITHISKRLRLVCIGNICDKEEDNHDEYAIAVNTEDDEIVGYVPVRTILFVS